MALRRVGLREDDRPGGMAGVRDERLRAVEDVLVAAALRGRLQVGDVGAGLGLGEPERAEDRLLEERRQPLRLLLLAAGDDHGRRSRARWRRSRWRCRSSPSSALPRRACRRRRRGPGPRSARARAGSSGRARAPSRSRRPGGSGARRTRPPSAGSPSRRSRARARGGSSAPRSGRTRRPSRRPCSIVAMRAPPRRRLTSQSKGTCGPAATSSLYRFLTFTGYARALRWVSRKLSVLAAAVAASCLPRPRGGRGLRRAPARGLAEGRGQLHQVAPAASRRSTRSSSTSPRARSGARCSWLKSPRAHASSHYVVSRRGRIVQLVHLSDIAWHAGNWNVNTQSVGIEHEGFTYGRGRLHRTRSTTRPRASPAGSRAAR